MMSLREQVRAHEPPQPHSHLLTGASSGGAAVVVTVAIDSQAAIMVGEIMREGRVTSEEGVRLGKAISELGKET